MAEKPIPVDAPGRLIAQFLRLLRRLADSPSYRTLAPIAHVTQNALSQHASGQRVIQWESMRLYVDTVLRYADQHDIDLSARMREHAERFQVDPAADILTQARAVYDRNVAMTLLTRDTIDTIEEARSRIEEQVAEERETAVPGPLPPDSLAVAETSDEVVGALNDLVLQQGWNLSGRIWDVARVNVPGVLLHEETLDALTGRVELSDRIYAEILHACGAGVFDEDNQMFHPYHKEWTLAWQRARNRPAPPGGTSTGDDTTSGIPVPADGELAAPRWWRRAWLVVRQTVVRNRWHQHLVASTSAARPPVQRSADHDADHPVDDAADHDLVVEDGAS